MTDQYRALVRHFFGRFFDNEFVAQNADVYATVVKILALLATPGLCLPFFRYTTYLHLDHYPPAARLPVLWYDRCFFISFAMLVMGGVTVLEWDALFPDRRDYASLIPLPIRGRTMFLAKISALMLFLVGFTAIVNLPSSVMFPVFSFRNPGGGAGSLMFFWTVLAQAISVFCASAFVFLSMVAIEGVLLNVLSVRWFRKISVYVQCVTMFGLLSLFFVFQNMASKIATAREAVFAFPPAWFLGLNEVLLGSGDPAFHRLARIALGALGSALLISAMAYAVAYRRHVKRTLESTEGGDGSLSFTAPWVSALADRIVRDPVKRAVIAFVGKTAARSAKHRMFLAAYIGVGCAFILQALLEAGLKQAWLSAPLVLSFFVLSGLRYVFTIPAELPSNWIFRVTEFDRRALDGARLAMAWLAVVPLFAALAPFYFVIWPPAIASAHLVFSITVSLLLVETLLLDFWKIPFTCSYPPGKANVTILWIFYWLAFTTYAYSMATLEAWMVLRPMRLLMFYCAAAALWIGFEVYRRRSGRIGYALVFDDAADPVVRTLGISEIAWQK